MIRMDEPFAVAMVTVPDVETGRRLARTILEARAAACVNLIPGLESHYWWEGKLDTSSEVLLLIKTTGEKLSGLEKLVLANHPYDTAEFIVLPITQGAERYLKWVESSTQ
jgi:periplasmic divalent cation tolerance protein